MIAAKFTELGDLVWAKALGEPEVAGLKGPYEAIVTATIYEARSLFSSETRVILSGNRENGMFNGMFVLPLDGEGDKISE